MARRKEEENPTLPTRLGKKEEEAVDDNDNDEEEEEVEMEVEEDDEKEEEHG